MKQYIYVFGLMMMLLWACNSSDPVQEEGEGFNWQKDTTTVDNGPEVQLRALSFQIKQDPKNHLLYKDRSVLYHYLGKMDSAILDIEQALSIHNTDPQMQYLRGFYAFSQNDTALAFKKFQMAVALGSDNPEVFYQRGQIYFLQDKYELALQSYRRAFELDSMPIYVFAQGFLEEERGNEAKAIALYEQSIELDSAFDKALVRLHDFYIQRGNEAKAKGYIEQLKAVSPGHPLGHFHTGNALYRRAIQQGKQTKAREEFLADAVRSYSVAIRLDEQFVDAYYARGYAFFEAERLEEAVNDFQKVLEINPEQAQAHFMLASISEYYSDLESALQHYQAAARIDPSFEDAKRAAEELAGELR